MKTDTSVFGEKEGKNLYLQGRMFQTGPGQWFLNLINQALRNPYLLFLPFLVFFVILVIIKNDNAFEGDEARYYMFGQNLLEGYYSKPAPDIDLWNGPGYPLFLVPFILLNLPLIAIPLTNAVFHYLSVVFLFKALMRVASVKTALFFSLFWACYYNGYAEMPYILTESITAFLVSAIALCALIGFENTRYRHIILAGLLLGYLVLVKIIFSNVLLALLIGSALLWVFNRKKSLYKKAVLIPLIALLVNVPYLFYTWNLTGKKLYWGNSGGMSLYWMSTPYENEYGEWHNSDLALYDAVETSDSTIIFNEKKLQANHRADYDEIYKLKPIDRDDAFKRKAVENIKNHPVKFAKNVVANAGRMLFNFPYSYTYETYTSLVRVSVNGIVLCLMLLAGLITLLNWRRIDFPVRYILLIMLLYLGGSLLVSVYARMFYIILPWMFLWIGFVLDKTVRIRFSIPPKNLK